MGVTVSINGGPTSNITGYSVTEDSTPIDPSDSSGGVGQVNISLAESITTSYADGGVTYRTNYIKNPTFSTNTTDWLANGTGVTIARDTVTYYSSPASLKVVTPGTISGNEGTYKANSAIAGLTAGSSFSVSAWVKAPLGATMKIQASSQGTGAVSPIKTFTGTGGWQYVKVENATLGTSINPYTFIATNTTAQAITFYVDDVILEMTPTINSYFDGSTAANSGGFYKWSGTANNSASHHNSVIAEKTYDSELFINDSIDLEDGAQGTTVGTINSINIANGIANISGDSRIGAFMADRTAQPFNGTLQNAFIYYLGLVDITSGYYVDPSIASTTVVFPGFTGNMWDYMKKLCAAYKVEISLVSDNIVLRPIRTRTAENKRNIDESLSISNAEIAQSVEVYYYNNEYKSSTLVYPKGGWNADVQVYQVDALQTLEVEIPIDVSLTSIFQPTCVNSVARTYNGGANGVYCVAGKDGLPIDSAAWAANGGRLSVAIGDDTRSIKLTIVGASDFANVAPYRIAMASDTSNTYSSLRIVGTGVHFDKQKITIPTGVPATKSSVLVGATVDNPFISTISQAYDAGSIVAGKYASPSQKINVSTVGINRSGESGSINYPTFASFNSTQGTNTFATFNTAQGTNTFAAFNAQQFALVKDNFENQAFGNVAGSRVSYRNAMYRIRSANITESSVSYTAERDTLFSDWNSVWTGTTFADFDTQFAGKLFEDYAVIPLWQT